MAARVLRVRIHGAHGGILAERRMNYVTKSCIGRISCAGGKNRGELAMQKRCWRRRRLCMNGGEILRNPALPCQGESSLPAIDSRLLRRVANVRHAKPDLGGAKQILFLVLAGSGHWHRPRRKPLSFINTQCSYEKCSLVCCTPQ